MLGLLGCDGPEDPGWEGPGDACVTCHEGIERIHATIEADSCVVCHGGDASALEKERAHVPPPANYAAIRGDGLPPAPVGYIKDFAPNQLDQLPPEYVRFINPGDLRAAEATCGQCHAGKADSVKRSVMSTNAGHYMPTLFLAGYQDRTAIYGATALTDPECDPGRYEGSVCSLEPLEPPDRSVYDAALDASDLEAVEEFAYDHYLAKSCDTCHASGYGDNNAPHKYRSTGCTSCHMVYDTFGFYLGGDEAVPNATPSYSAEHVITRRIPTEQCATCHFQGGRIGLLYRGIREAGFSEKPPNAVAWEPGAYGKTNPDFYLSDEDDTNDFDESPPDLHYAAGMHCADCHVGTDVHGDGRIYTTSKQQVAIACEDCHGTVRERATPDSFGRFVNSKGGVLPQLSLVDGDVVLDSVDGTQRAVPQVATLLQERGPGSPMWEAMAPDARDWTHAEALTCDTCHTSYNLHCLGCHVSIDLRFDQVDHQTGLASPGLAKGSRETWSLTDVLLGVRGDGRVQTVAASHQVQMRVIDDDGTSVVGGPDPADPDRTLGVFRDGPTGQANNGFAPFFQHTTTAEPRTCATCHQTTRTPEELARVRGVYGFGTGELMLADPEGQPVDSLQFLDAAGAPITDWVHEGSGPVPDPQLQRALGVVLDEL